MHNDTIESTEITQYLTFKLADEIYAINVGHIREVLSVPRITRVPRMPSYLSGVINLRGNVIPVLDIREKFGMGKTTITGNTSIIVTEIEEVFVEEADSSMVIGIFSDEVQKVIDLDPSLIEGPPRIGSTIDTSFIEGMGKTDEGFVILLRLDRILSDTELSGITVEARDA